MRSRLLLVLSCMLMKYIDRDCLARIEFFQADISSVFTVWNANLKKYVKCVMKMLLQISAALTLPAGDFGPSLEDLRLALQLPGDIPPLRGDIGPDERGVEQSPAVLPSLERFWPRTMERMAIWSAMRTWSLRLAGWTGAGSAAFFGTRFFFGLGRSSIEVGQIS